MVDGGFSSNLIGRFVVEYDRYGWSDKMNFRNLISNSIISIKMPYSFTFYSISQCGSYLIGKNLHSDHYRLYIFKTKQSTGLKHVCTHQNIKWLPNGFCVNNFGSWTVYDISADSKVSVVDKFDSALTIQVYLRKRRYFVESRKNKLFFWQESKMVNFVSIGKHSSCDYVQHCHCDSEENFLFVTYGTTCYIINLDNFIHAEYFKLDSKYAVLFDREVEELVVAYWKLAITKTTN